MHWPRRYVLRRNNGDRFQRQTEQRPEMLNQRLIVERPGKQARVMRELAPIHRRIWIEIVIALDGDPHIALRSAQSDSLDRPAGFAMTPVPGEYALACFE